MTYEEQGTLSAYEAFRKERPELFDTDSSQAGDTIQILTAPADIEGAREAARVQRAARGLRADDTRVGILAVDPYMTLLRDPVRFPDGSLGLYNRILEGPAVAALPIYQGRLVLLRIFRHGLRGWSIEFPRGACDPGEPAPAAIRREIAEEIGADPVELIDMGDFTPGGSTLAIKARLFAVRITQIGAPDRRDAIAQILVREVDDVERMISSGEIVDGFTMSLFLRGRLRGLI